MCQKTATDPVLYQVTNVEWHLAVLLYFNITNNMTTYIHIGTFDLQPIGYSNNTVSVSFGQYNTIVKPLVATAIKTEINDVKFPYPKPIGDFLRNHSLGALDLKNMTAYANKDFLTFNWSP